MKTMRISLWVLILLFWFSRACLSCTEEERNGLLKFMAFAGKNDERSDCCGWDRVKCDNMTSRVVSLDLSINLASYTDGRVLDASLFLPFRHLQYLNLSSNWYSILQNGQDLGKLNKLEVLILKVNSFNDTSVFQPLSALTSLTALDLSSNKISGSLSDFGQDLCKLRNLQELYLGWNKLSGSIPPCFDNLTSLRALDLSYNNLVGRFYPSLLVSSLEYLCLNDNPQFDANPMFASLAGREFQLRYLGLSRCNINTSTTDLLKILHSGPKLLALELSNNKLHGEFPNSFFEENFNLEILALKNNSLTGNIHLPSERPVNLELFDVSYNHMQGELQPNLGHVLPNLTCLNIANNNIGGEIPRSIHAMKDLVKIDLSSNNLSGKLPERLDLSCKRLKWIRLSNNRLEGRIPGNIFNLTKLYVLDLSNNQFSGHIPSYNYPSSLLLFKINKNHISGRIPNWLCNSTSFLYYLDLSQNQFSGSLPSCLITMPLLMHLYLRHNKLTGPLPKALPSNTSSLLTLDISDNDLSGKIPSWFGFLLDLRVLSMKGNRFSGSIPHELCRLHKIGIIDLSHNILSGSMPSCFINITFGRGEDGNEVWSSQTFSANYLSTLDKNILQDLIVQPEQFLYDSFSGNANELEDVQFVTKSRTNYYKGAGISFMSGMDLSCNNLEGGILHNIGALTELHAMNLSHNRFTGEIPLSMSNMKQIESLDLSHNKLSGEIPSNLTRLSFLVVFNVAYNNLSGRVPEMAGQFNTFSEASYEGNPFLCGPPLLKQCNINSDLVNSTDTIPGGNKTYWIDPISFLTSFAATYATCLLSLVIVLGINPDWRQRWFHFIDECVNIVFHFVPVLFTR